MNGLKNVVGRIEGDTFTLLATATESPGEIPTPDVPILIIRTGTVTLESDTGGKVQIDTLLKDPDESAYISLAKGVRALNDKAQRLSSLSLFMVGDPQNIGPYPEGEEPLVTYHMYPDGATFSPSAELGIRISDNAAVHHLYRWSDSPGRWYAVDAEVDSDDGYLKAAITKTGYYMMTYPSAVPTEPTAEPTILPTASPTPDATPVPTPTQTPLGVFGVLAGMGAFALLKRR